MNSKEALKILLDGDKVCLTRGSEDYYWYNDSLGMLLDNRGARVALEDFMCVSEYYY